MSDAISLRLREAIEAFDGQYSGEQVRRGNPRIFNMRDAAEALLNAREETLARSSTVEPSAHNALVPGSNPGGLTPDTLSAGQWRHIGELLDKEAHDPVHGDGYWQAVHVVASAFLLVAARIDREGGAG